MTETRSKQEEVELMTNRLIFNEYHSLQAFTNIVEYQVIHVLK